LCTGSVRSSAAVTVRASQKAIGLSIFAGPMLRQNCTMAMRRALATTSADMPDRASARIASALPSR
jgi:hypothetical protein